MTPLSRFLGLALVLSLSLSAWSDPPPTPNAPPPEVQRILLKMHSGTPPTPDEQATLRAWQSHKMGAAEGGGPDAGFMPPDVAAIMQKARQGIAPSQDDIAKLKAWGEQTKGHKSQMLQTAGQLETTLDAAKPPGSTTRGALSDNLMHGHVSVNVTQDVLQKSDQGSSHSHTTLNVTFPVAYRLESDMKRGGNFKLTLLADGAAQPTGSLTLTGDGNTSCSTSKVDGSASVSGWAPYFRPNPKLATNNQPIAIISRPAGAPRPYLVKLDLPLGGQGTSNSRSEDHCNPKNSSSGSGPLPVTQVAQLTWDNLMSGVDGSAFGPQNAAVLQQYGVPSIESQSPELKEMFGGVTFNFPADAFPQQFARGKFSSQATYRYTLKTKDSNGAGQVTSTAAITFEGGPPLKLKAYIEPVALDDYKNWIPQGPSYPSQHGEGNTLDVHLILVNTDTQQAVADSFAATYYLRNGSHLPGWCTNYPIPSAADGDYLKPDLRFVASSNASSATISNDQQQLDTAPDGGDGKVTITSYDYGSYGSLQADVTLSDGTKLNAEVRPEVAAISGQSNALTVPPDKNGNHISDAWEKQNGFTDKLANWDDDETPSGQNGNGDGLTLFEEYRGIVENVGGGSGRYTKLDPHTKDAFVSDPNGLFVNYYLPSNPAQVKWHIVDPRMFTFTGGGANDPNDRWLNVNTPEEGDLRYARQYVMIVRSGCVPDTYVGPGGNGTAGRSITVAEDTWDLGLQPKVLPTGQPCQTFSAAQCCDTGMRDFMAKRGHQAGVSASQIKKAQEAQVATLVIHEVGHLLGILHHRPAPENGNQTCPMVYGDTNNWHGAWESSRYTNYCRKDGDPLGPDDCFAQIKVKCDP